jgi:signal peptide peptidase SppA
MTMLLRIAERAFNRPLLILPQKAQIILGVLEGRIPVGANLDEVKIDIPEAAAAALQGPAASRFVGSSVEEDEASGRRKALPYRLTEDGVAVITVIGSLVNRGAWVGAYSGVTSYEGIRHQLASALASDRVASIVLDIESPGGEAVGAMELAAAVRAARDVKPVVAVVNGMAASAAYAFASGATRIVTAPTGLVGSIGVVMLHVDYSRKLDREGVTPTLIFAGEHKVDGHPFGPLPADVQADLRAEVARFYDLFVETVAAGRPGMTPDNIRGTQARVFIGQDAVAAGLADEVGSFESVLADMPKAAAGRRSQLQRGSAMSGTTPTPAADAPVGVPQAQHDKAVADATAAGRVLGAADERARFKAVLALDSAQTRQASALHMALNTDLSAEAIGGVLAGLPENAPSPAAAAAAPTVVPAAERRSQGAAGGLVTATGPDAGATAKQVVASGWEAAFGRTNAR